MRAKGVEPSRPKGHQDLNLARLPIPPRSRVSYCVLPRSYCVFAVEVGICFDFHGLFFLALLFFCYFFDALLGLLEYRPAVLYQGHAFFVLVQAFLQRYAALFDPIDDVRQPGNRFLETQFFDILFLILVRHFFNF